MGIAGKSIEFSSPTSIDRGFSIATFDYRGATIPKNVYSPANDLDVLSFATTGHVYPPFTTCFLLHGIRDGNVSGGGSWQMPELTHRYFSTVRSYEVATMFGATNLETGVHWQTQNFIINHQSCEWFIVVAKSQEACEKKLFVVAACPRFAMIVRERTLVTFNKNMIYKWTMKKTYVDWWKKGNYIYCSYKRLVGWDSNVFCCVCWPFSWPAMEIPDSCWPLLKWGAPLKVAVYPPNSSTRRRLTETDYAGQSFRVIATDNIGEQKRPVVIWPWHGYLERETGIDLGDCNGFEHDERMLPNHQDMKMEPWKMSSFNVC